MRALLGFGALLWTSTARADAPSGYQCAPGTAKIGVGCACPAGYVEKRLDENIAGCAATGPSPEQLKAECNKLGGAIRDGKTKIDAGLIATAATGTNVPDFRAALGPLLADECANNKWSPAQRTCFANAKDGPAAWDCFERLTAEQRDGVNVAIVRAGPALTATPIKDLRWFNGRIAFVGDRLSPHSERVLVPLAALLNEHTAMRLELRVHSDSLGKHAEKLASTQARADTLRLRVLELGKLTPDRVLAKGYGDTQPIEPNRTARGRAVNRRVEVLWLPPVEKPAPPVEKPAPLEQPAPPVEQPSGVRPPVAADLAKYLTAIPGSGSQLGVTFDTTAGTVSCTLFGDKAPMTVANFIGLATAQKPWLDRSNTVRTTRFYDGLTFHRVIPGFMIQGGDPLGTGLGGPGYRFADEKHDAFAVHAGSLVMANAGPDTNGSQFFIAEARAAHLDKRHTVFGQCYSLDTVMKIARSGAASNNRPTTPVVIKRVTITRTVPKVSEPYD